MKTALTKNYFNRIVIALAMTAFLQSVSNAQTVTVSTFAGSGTTGDIDGTGTAASFGDMYQFSIDGSGNIYAADAGYSKIRKITPAGVVTTFAGSGTVGNTDGPKESATFKTPVGVAVDVTSGIIYVVDQSDRKIRKIAVDGTVSTFAGSGAAGSDDGTGTAASFNNPYMAAVDASGNLFVTDHNNHTIRKITPSGVVTTFAGTIGVIGSADGIGTAASFNYPRGLAFDGLGNLYVTDQGNNTIRKITPAGVVSTLAGSTGSPGNNNGTGTAASFQNPVGIATDGSGNIYVTELSNNDIRKITPAGVVTTYAGNGLQADNDGSGIEASFAGPWGITIDANGNVFVSDRGNRKIREIKVDNVTSIETGDHYPSLKVYPNPSQDLLNFDLEDTKHIVLTDLTGKVYMDETSSTKTLRVGILPKGIYLLEVKQETKTYRNKLVVQ